MKEYFLAVCAIGACLSATAQQKIEKTYVINTSLVKAHVQPTMYGIFFEDINMAADGGLYAELVKNRSFEFIPNLMGWTEIKKDNGSGDVQVINRAAERPENPHFITLNVKSDEGYYGLSNEGFRGMGIKKGEDYKFSVLARQHAGSKIKLYVELVDENGAVLGTATLSPDASDWKKYEVKFQSNGTVNRAHLNLWAQNTGSIDLDMVSLFPQHTWKNRPNGLRADMVQKLADMKPGFLRFPGGCIVEGRDLANRYQWKKTIGDIDKRESIINRWNTEFKSRSTPDYYQSFGLGFLEYFQLAEDIGAEPLPILNCGMACQFNTGQLVPLDQLDPYVQDALDLIEFANGSTDTKWGNLRAKLGHPAPFNLKMMGVGNEQWGDEYIPRWKIFVKAIKDKYPYMKLVSSVGPDPDGPKFDFLNTTFRGLHADILDEHYYRAPQWFLDNVKRYDNYDRKGPKIFAGEYAAQSVGIASPDNKNNWDCAMSEAAFMTGLERNADIVKMASYAPLFAQVDGWQWTPDLIWFNNLDSYETPNYYVQKLYSLNKGTDVVPLTLDNAAVTGQNGAYATAVIDKKTNELIIKFVNTSKESQNISFNVKGFKQIKPTGTLTTLQSDNLDEVNSFDKPAAIFPKEQTITTNGNNINLVVKRYSLNIIKVKLSN
ncbi:alpha-L-arabinofuranosidase C-terminal domain-containing protein [Mucilaginibacter sp. L196]|uniref:alpha-L-arabinofuranosidase C-terminal domain-containing protein n=1 Tax=Mucilaginibacter sp. L196 TaxID=1641870 RepID=UPI00131E7BD4|nr:alpha-L-arabinofuranosidase C-terminal domain-containing protein [Mucilaginibacter sp. L196]